MSFIKPVSGTITQTFGPTTFEMEPSLTWHGVYYDHFHQGIDYGTPTGNPVWAAANGYVRETGWDISLAQGGGIGVWVQHTQSLHTIYAHLSQSLVSVGQQVVAGQTIALSGESGNVTGPHLHFGVYTRTPEWGFSVDDPAQFLSGGALASTITTPLNDIPTIEPLAGTLVRMALCVPVGDGTYAVPTEADTISSVYYDRLRVSPDKYDVLVRSFGVFIDPHGTLSESVEVRVDYLA